MQEFSLTEVIIAAVITFLISGVGGVVLTRFIERSRPKLAVTSVGFRGDVVHLSETAVEASEDDDWGPSLKSVIPYKTASDREQNCSRLILELGHVKSAVDDWVGRNLEDEPNHTLTKSELKRCPYFRYNLIGSSIMGRLRRRSLPELPLNIEVVNSLERKYDLEEKDDGWHIHLGQTGCRFPKHEDLVQNELDLQELIAESFSRGSLKNIRELLEIFSADSANHIAKLMKLRDELRSCISRDAHIVVDAAVSNLGSQPVVVNPYFVAIIKLGEDETKLLFRISGDAVIEAEEHGHNPLAAMLRANKDSDSTSGNMFEVMPFLSDVRSSPHVSIPGGSNEKVTLISTEPMGDRAKSIVAHFELGALKCELAATTSSGRKFRSASLSFGKELSQNQKSSILGAA